jgi:DNA polymerase-3 subunit gamma/tau
MSLYRKYRPQKFLDLVGQEHVKTTLTNALKTGKFAHAYLFSGPKGSGKTTTARLLAKALNCSGRDLVKGEIEPCEKCLSCREITAGQSMDVMEIDAASNRGIDEIRELRDKIRFAPTAGKFKIYVVDECHMLTKEAFNALLKTLEEPPAHAIFILATTELHKVPATILSRVQVFDFKKAKTEDIVFKLKKIIKAEKLEIEEEALHLIARLAYGAFRDAETMLDQVANLGSGQAITLAQVQLILGETTEQSAWDLVEVISKKDRALAMKIIGDVYFEGKNLESFVLQIIEIFRLILLAQNGIVVNNELTKEEAQKIESLTQAFESQELVLIITKLTEILPRVKAAILGQLPLEMLVFELTEGQINTSKSISQNDNEKLVIEGKKTLKPEPVFEEIAPPKHESKSENAQQTADNSLISIWPEIVKKTKEHNNAMGAMLKDTVISSVQDERVILGAKFKFHADQICGPKIRQMIEAVLKEKTGKDYKIECMVNQDLKIKKPVDADEESLNAVKEIFETE